MCDCDFSQKVIEQLESKISSLREDLVTTKEALNRALLDKEVLEGQKIEVGQCPCCCFWCPAAARPKHLCAGCLY